MRRTLVGAAAAAGLLALPGVATADVVFDPADADELATVLAEATADQDVCYGWDVTVDDAIMGKSQSVGSNFGAGMPPTSGTCRETVQFNAYITYTSDSSESEDSASYDVVSSPGGPTRADMEGLDIDFDALTGEDVDAVVGKAVAALPLLAADKGLAKPIEAAPETGAAPADAQLTDDPDSDWWRNNGGATLWGVGLLLGGGIFAWWAFRTSRKTWRAPQRNQGPQPVPSYVSDTVPDTVPADFYESYPLAEAPTTEQTPTLAPKPTPTPTEGTKATAAPEPSLESTPAAAPQQTPAPESAEEPAVAPESSPDAKPATQPLPTAAPEDTPAPPSEKDPAPSDQKDKE